MIWDHVSGICHFAAVTMDVCVFYFLLPLNSDPRRLRTYLLTLSFTGRFEPADGKVPEHGQEIQDRQ
uniref:Uncharacterized protein n=1 Tax=Kalanchoe fedtschenkoi TaxID=63787 RepID=A0A7N0SY80_KALFE